MPAIEAADRHSFENKPPRGPVLGSGFLISIALLILACAVLFTAAGYVVGTLVRAHLG